MCEGHITLLLNSDGSDGNTKAQLTMTRPAHIISKLHDAPRGILSGLAEQVVEVEGPIHIDKIVNRVRAAWRVTATFFRYQIERPRFGIVAR